MMSNPLSSFALKPASAASLYRWGIFPLWALLTATLLFRPIIPLDETRYLSVAWEMWQRADFLVPYLNGQPYSHKPPLLFWLIHAGWSVFGINDWSPRLIGPLCSLLNLVLIRTLAAKLWPNSPIVAWTSPWFLLGTLPWTLFATATMFDTLLTDCVLVGMLGLIAASQTAARLLGWSCFALATGLGLLAKGPVVLLYLLPCALTVRFWLQTVPERWFIHLVIALSAGMGLALCWAIPAAAAGGENYAGAILWHQTADRAAGTRIHARPFFLYLLFLPLLTFPWISWRPLWRGGQWQLIKSDPALRFCWLWLLSAFLLFSLLPSKQLHYLIPALPAFALICARYSSLPQTIGKRALESLPGLLLLAIGGLLALIPSLPGLADLRWAQSIEPTWGLSVAAIALTLTLYALVRGRLPIAAIAAAMTVSICIGFFYFFRDAGSQYDLRPAANFLKQLDEQQIPNAFIGDYQGQLHFLGRLTQPIAVIQPQQAKDWYRQHPNGYLLSVNREKPERAGFLQAHREYWLAFQNADDRLKPKPHKP
ncbi:ArnT family glycosyltransferase [Methylomonas sp. HYX-M1]|uniref:ArnT family glycosyltransferase n=1 Tax=Methylomonas sp. HYX-M1 TaxID=3139307 RepID=UPI00345B8247